MPNRCTIRVLEFTEALDDARIDAMRNRHGIMIKYVEDQDAGWPIYDATGQKHQLIDFLTSHECGMDHHEVFRVYPELK